MPTIPDPLNAFLDLPQAPVLHAQSGPLAGLSLAVKDIFDVAGYPTGCGNPQKLAECEPARVTAPAVQSLLDAGARFVGKTQTDELAFSLMGLNAHFATPVNPAAPGRVTGGSSSGSATAVAGGLADIALGSDTGGSIRAPASFCGLIGLRATHGRTPLEGVMPLAPSFDVVGWFARDIDVYEKVAEVLLNGNRPPLRFAAQTTSPPLREGEDGGEPSARPLPSSGGEVSKRSRDGEGVTLANSLALPNLEELLLSDSARSEFWRMLGIVSGVLGEAEPRSLNHNINDLYWCFRKLQAYEAWAVHGQWISKADRGLGPGVKERFEFGSTLGCEVAAEETKRRAAFRAELTELLGEDGVMVLPTVPGAAPLKSASFDELQDYREKALRLLCLAGLSGLPQISLPLGAVEDAPFGISLLGPAGADLALIRLGRQILQAAGKG